jgi:hypothetical protein
MSRRLKPQPQSGSWSHRAQEWLLRLMWAYEGVSASSRQELLDPDPWDGMDLRVSAPRVLERLRARFQDCKARCCCRIEESGGGAATIDLYRRQADGSGALHNSDRVRWIGSG